MDSILPTNLDPSQTAVVNQHTPQTQYAQPEYVPQQPAGPPPLGQIIDTRTPGAPPLPNAAPTPAPNSASKSLGSRSPKFRPGEKAAAIAALVNTKEEVAPPETMNGNWNRPDALTPANIASGQAGGSQSPLVPKKETAMEARPDLNKVKLPDPTSMVTVKDELNESESTPVAAKPIKEAKPVRPEVDNPISKEPLQSSTKPSPKAAAKKATAPVEKEKPEPAAPTVDLSNSAQLALQVIFGFEGALSREEVLKLARDLEGIREVKKVGGDEAAALKTLVTSAEEFGYGGEKGLILRSDGYPLEFIEEGGICLCVILEKTVLPKGTREKLTLITREVARLSQ